MRRKIERLRRIERLRKQMHEISTWRLAVVAHERVKLTASHAEMLEALGQGLMAFGPAAGLELVNALQDEPALQGYHLLHWATPDYYYWVASDLGISELADFAALLKAADPEPRRTPR